METELKEIITCNVQTQIKSLVEKNHSRVTLKDFKEIVIKQLGESFLFYHPVYGNKNIEFFNEEENTDFLVFENNNIYIDYSDNLFTFHKIDEEEKILEVDLDNQEICVKKDVEDEENLSNEITKKIDLITLNYFPLSQTHCNLTLCYDQDLPQVLSTEFIVQMLQIFLIGKDPSLRCGYDSLGGGCLINHLHFEFLLLDDFQGVQCLPIENRESTNLLKTHLKHQKDDEISMFDDSTMIIFSILKYPFFCWKLEAVDKDNSAKDALSSFQNSISHLTNLILSNLIEGEIPHNLVICNYGRIFYIIPRKFDKKEYPINTCWSDLAGFTTFKSQSDFEKYSTADSNEELENFIHQNISLDENDFLSLNEKIVGLIESIYEIEKC